MCYKLKEFICKKCGKRFKRNYKDIKYCSLKCYGLTRKGKKYPSNIKRKMSKIREKLLKEGKIKVWNKGLSKELQPRYNQKVSKKTRLKISKATKGKKVLSFTKEHRKKLSDIKKGFNKGKTYEEIYGKQKAKKLIKLKSGKNHHNWKGGITPLHFRIRNSLKYKLWRKGVFERDNYICQRCKRGKVYLNAHHIKSFSLYPKLRFNISNGITLCEPCHKILDKR